MNNFLQIVAADVYQRMGGNLSHTVVVFPNKRAKLFFDEYLSKEASAPMWAPTYMSIRELFCSMSSKAIGDSVKLICELYRSFKKECQSQETLNDFYFWGEMLLEDFNDVDKCLVDTKALFSNLEALKQLTDYSFLNEERRKALETFFQHYNKGEHTNLKERFEYIWNRLGAIYDDYRSSLSKQGIAYEGMLYREVIEDLDLALLPYDKYVFVGFNVLTEVEYKLFAALQKADKALFYWDYDMFYIDKANHEAGKFLSRNIKDFPSPLPNDMFNTLSAPKEIQFVEASTESAQARYLTQWTRENLTPFERETAVVLCNESLLLPVIHSLPNNVKHINITMGYPFVQTTAHSFLIALLEAHTQGYNAAKGTYRLNKITPLLKHPLVHRLSQQAGELEHILLAKKIIFPRLSDLSIDEFIAQLLQPVSENIQLCELMAWAIEKIAETYREGAEGEADEVLQIDKEALFKAYTLVNRFHTLMEEDDMFASISTNTFFALLKRALSTVKIPFYGEPAEGLQVMGVLETRNLDFKHIVMLSVNEGYMPRVNNDVSFIPFNLRKAFGMTTIEHKISINAYYFYRLLQRAEKVTLLYNTVTDGKQRGEWSRFLMQLLVEYPHDIQRYRLAMNQKPNVVSTIEITKTPDVMRALRQRFDISINKRRLLSPSALNAYIDCSLKFYYKYVAGLRAQEEVDEEVDNIAFGTLFHKTAEDIYNDLKGDENIITKEALQSLIDDDQKIKDYVAAAFNKEFFMVGEGVTVDYNGLQLINKEVIAKYVHRLLELDYKRAPFKFVAAEKEVKEIFEISTAEGAFNIHIGGIIDRLDSSDDNTLRIVDYKTGGAPKFFKDIRELFVPAKERANYIFQTFLYASIMRHYEPDKTIQPALLYINQAASQDYEPLIRRGTKAQNEVVTDFTDEYDKAFRSELQSLLNDRIFKKDVPFKQTEIDDKCSTCDFLALCNQGE